MDKLSGWEVYKAIEMFHPNVAPNVIFWGPGSEKISSTGAMLLEKPVDPSQLLDVLPLLVEEEWLDEYL